ncbi:MAG: hypothetical protein ASARMPRED_006068 [Alectoria sarmentosa]|nr:MAG: hypothetical protein ASARMPRED_006068 [Alectoria sarmentosa]
MSAVASSPVVLILGAGANVGAHVARAFAAKGYRVASTSRTIRDQETTSNDGVELHLQSDLANPESVAGIFAKVLDQLGPPSVVVYNAAASTPSPPQDPLSVGVPALSRDLNINTVSAIAAAHEAVLAFEPLPASASRTFIYTGNGLNSAPMAPLLSLGVGKAATAHAIASAAVAYKEKGYRFYYADERTPDGSIAGRAIDGSAHAEFYVQLAERETQGPWLATFVKGKGYVEF